MSNLHLSESWWLFNGGMPSAFQEHCHRTNSGETTSHNNNNNNNNNKHHHHKQQQHQQQQQQHQEHYHLRQLRVVSRSLSSSSTSTLVHAFIANRLDYCSSLYCGLP